VYEVDLVVFHGIEKPMVEGDSMAKIEGWTSG
jgi:hypothetical protein